MPETEKAKPSDPLQQGDIIKVEADKSQGSSPTLGVIINADCDLAHDKLDGVIAYLPMYTFKEYLALFWAPAFLADHSQMLTKRIRKLCRLDDQGEMDLLDWLKAGDLAEIASKLSQTCQLKDKDASELLRQLSALRLSTDQTRDPIAAFAEVCRQENDPSSFARKKLAHAQTNMGDGHFFVNELPSEDGIGFVVRMRRICSIKAPFCFKTRSEELASTATGQFTAHRIARFQAAYRFRIAQMFAYQYSRIGLPDEASALRSLAIDDVVLNILNGDQ